MPKRLTRLKISEVSAVDSGAGRGVKVVLMKKDGQRSTEADELVVKRGWDVLDSHGAVVASYGSKKRAKRERDRINAARRRGENLAKAIAEIDDHKHAAHTEDTNMYTDVQKAAALTVVQKFNDRVQEVAQRDRISHSSAMAKIAGASVLVAPADASLWNAYRSAAEVIKADPVAPALAPAPTVSAAYVELQKRAAKLQKRDPKLSAASAFAKAYSAPENRDLAEADRAFHFNKSAGGSPVDANEQLIIALMASLGIDRNHAAGMALEMRAKRPPQAALTHTTRDAA